LMCLGEIRTRRAIRIDDAFGQKVQYRFILLYWFVGGEGDRSCDSRRR
jgi:hypothetical protein